MLETLEFTLYNPLMLQATGVQAGPLSAGRLDQQLPLLPPAVLPTFILQVPHPRTATSSPPTSSSANSMKMPVSLTMGWPTLLVLLLPLLLHVLLDTVLQRLLNPIECPRRPMSTALVSSSWSCSLARPHPRPSSTMRVWTCLVGSNQWCGRNGLPRFSILSC